MEMKMNIADKDVLLLGIIDEHASTQKTNPFYIPLAHFEAKGLDESDVRNALWRLKDQGLVKTYRHCWGFFELLKNKKKTFVVTGTEQHTDDDFEVYEIKADTKKIAAVVSRNAGDIQHTFYFDAHGDLYSAADDNVGLQLQRGSISFKIIDYFIEHPNHDYEDNTSAIAVVVDVDEKQLRTELGKLRRRIKNVFKLDSLDFIESRQGSGYRLNPAITIIKK